jgi:hypothetical protein
MNHAHDRLCGEHPAPAGGVNGLGGRPVVVGFGSGGAALEVAARAGHRELATGLLRADVT